MFRHLTPALVLAVLATLPAIAQDSDSHDKNLDIRSSMGDLHVGKDADARKTGLPLYPGAQLTSDKGNSDSDQANLSILTDAFGMKLVVAKYQSDDPPSKIIDFYRGKLKTYGKVLECRTQKHGGDVDIDSDEKDSKSTKELKCDGGNSGPVTELKVGTEDNQRIVAIEPRESKGTTFALVYVHTRGKRGEI